MKNPSGRPPDGEETKSIIRSVRLTRTEVQNLGGLTVAAIVRVVANDRHARGMIRIALGYDPVV